MKGALLCFDVSDNAIGRAWLLARLLEDQALRLRLGAAGSELARASLSGARLAERLSALYLSLAAAAAQTSP